MKNIENLKCKLKMPIILGLFIMLPLTFLTCNKSKHNKLNTYVNRIYYPKILNYEKQNKPDTISFDYDKINFQIETFHITENITSYIKIISNESISICRIQTVNDFFENLYIQVTLKKEVDKYFKSLLYDLYSKHTSALLDSIPKPFKYVRKSAMPYWAVKITFKDSIIEEIIPYWEYAKTYFDMDYNPFYDQYYKIRQLMSVIKGKLEHELYQTKYYNEDDNPEWIKENFNGNLYENFCPINSNIKVKDVVSR